MPCEYRFRVNRGKFGEGLVPTTLSRGWLIYGLSINYRCYFISLFSFTILCILEFSWLHILLPYCNIIFELWLIMTN